MLPFSLYIHIPFCSKKCPYCDFTTYAVKKLPEEEYCEALRSELSLYASDPRFATRKIDTIFWGGGTPSMLSAEQMGALHRQAQHLFGFSSEEIEITCEANPKDVSAEKAQGLHDAGINRLSLGAQSLQQRILTLLGRDHSPAEVKGAVQNARSAQVNNISLDLIFAAPEQTSEELLKDIEGYDSLSPNHISAYNLTIEKGTPFFQAVQNNTLTPLPDHHERELYELLLAELPKRGYEQYEVSNFSREDRQCAHNMHYWHRDDYLGIGVGAHSYARSSDGTETRWANTASVNEYQEKTAQEKKPTAWAEELSEREKLTEQIMLGLRLHEGIQTGHLPKLLQEEIVELETAGLGASKSGRFSLTDSGMACADSIASDLIKHLPH